MVTSSNSQEQQVFPRPQMGGNVFQAEWTAKVGKVLEYTVHVRIYWGEGTRQKCNEMRLKTETEDRLKNGRFFTQSWQQHILLVLLCAMLRSLYFLWQSRWESQSFRQTCDVSMCFRKINAVEKCYKVRKVRSKQKNMPICWRQGTRAARAFQMFLAEVKCVDGVCGL